jgi:hypothetical protein
MKKLLAAIIIFLSASIQVYSQCNTALIISQGRPAFASSVESATYEPDNAFDGDRTTRWSSAFSDPQYLYVDLGAVTDLCQVNLIWENAYGKDFTIDVSDDAATWTNAATITGNTSLTNNIPITGSGRYVRMNGTARGTSNGYSLYGMHVYGTAPSPSCGGTDLALGGAAVSSSDESIAFPAFQAFDGNLGTRWSSAFSDPQNIYVDLGGTYDLCNVTLSWEAAYATDFHIDVSQDAVDWATLVTVTGNTSLTNTIPISGLARYVRMFGTARATMYGYSLLEFTVNGFIASVLPITLHEFTASVQSKKTVLLQWTTDLETNNDHFDIERSMDGNHFSTIGTIKGKGNSSTRTRYTWVDSLPAPGVNEYRLRQVDLDGKYSYSPITQVTINARGQTTISAYPNPVTNYLTINSPAGEQIVSVNIYNAIGVSLMKYTDASDNKATLSMKIMPPVVYTIRVNTNHGIQTVKVLKSPYSN